jgi:hypothetical protein
MLNVHMTEDEIIAAKRRIQAEKGYTDSEATLAVTWRILGPIMQMVKDTMDIEDSVTAYRKGEIEKRKSRREKRE